MSHQTVPHQQINRIESENVGQSQQVVGGDQPLIVAGSVVARSGDSECFGQFDGAHRAPDEVGQHGAQIPVAVIGHLTSTSRGRWRERSSVMSREPDGTSDLLGSTSPPGVLRAIAQERHTLRWSPGHTEVDQ